MDILVEICSQLMRHPVLLMCLLDILNQDPVHRQQRDSRDMRTELIHRLEHNLVTCSIPQGFRAVVKCLQWLTGPEHIQGTTQDLMHSLSSLESPGTQVVGWKAVRRRGQQLISSPLALKSSMYGLLTAVAAAEES